MQSYSDKGKVCEVFDTQQVTEKFRKKEFVIEIISSNQRGTYVDYVKFQAVQSNCEVVENLQVGDLVVVKWALMGRRWKKEGQYRYFTNVEALDVTVVTPAAGGGSDEIYDGGLPLDEDDPFTLPPERVVDSPSVNSSEDGEDDLPF